MTWPAQMSLGNAPSKVEMVLIGIRFGLGHPNAASSGWAAA